MFDIRKIFKHVLAQFFEETLQKKHNNAEHCVKSTKHIKFEFYFSNFYAENVINYIKFLP